jgi:hypothetical protein
VVFAAAAAEARFRVPLTVTQRQQAREGKAAHQNNEWI